MHARSRSRATLVGAGLLLAFGIQHGAAGATIHRTAVGTSAGIPNVRVSHDRYPDHAEPALAINPRDPHNLLGAAMDFDRSPTPGTFVSFDGGKTWHDNGALPLPAGFGKISPSISQKALRSLYQVSSGILARIGLRGYVSLSI